MKYIVSEKYKFVYFVVPKVACTSIKSALVPLFELDTNGYWRGKKPENRRLRVHKIFDDSSYQLSYKQLQLNWNDRLDGYFSFAFVRNPWDRLVSCWHNKIYDRAEQSMARSKRPLHGPSGDPDLFDKKMEFSEFVRVVAAIDDKESDIHFRSQFTILQSPWRDGELLPQFIGKFENLEEDFNHVAYKIGKPELELPHRMKSKTRDAKGYRDFYTEELRDIVKNRYARDVDEFSYSF